MSKWIEKIKHNHGLMMIICCLVPLALLFAAVKYFGLSRSYLFLFILLLCPVMHYFIMKDMHKKSSEKKEDGKCH